MTRLISRTLALVALVLTTQGCDLYGVLGPEGPLQIQGDVAYTPEPIEVHQAALGGNFASQPATRSASIEGSRSGNWTSITLLSQGDHEATMAILEVWDGLESIPTGEVQRYVATGDGVDGAVSVVGCVGPAPYNWSRDESADSIELLITEHPDDPGVRRVEFRAHFDAPDYPTDHGITDPTTLSGHFLTR